MRFLTTFLLLCLSATLTANIYADTESQREIQEAEIKMDTSDLKDVKKAITVANKTLTKISKKEDTQFNKMLKDVIGGSYKSDKYLIPVQKKAFKLIKHYNGKLPPSTEKKTQSALERAKRRKDDKWVKNAQDTLNNYRLLKSDIEKYSQYLSKDGKTLTLTNKIFQSRADETVSRAQEKSVLLKYLDLDEDKLKYFLTGYTEKIYPKIVKGEKPITWSTYKNTVRDALIKIHKMDTYGVEKQLRNAVEKYPEKDAVALLYSYILLINKSDSKRVELGYRHLNRAFDRLETEKLGYNLVRVGLRIGKLKEGQILKIIDHVSHRKDTKTLAKLNNMLLYFYLKNGDYDKAADYMEELESFHFDLTKISPAIKFILYLKQGNYELIATDVAPYDSEKQVKELITS